jgi:hypothetical protein
LLPDQPGLPRVRLDLPRDRLGLRRHDLQDLHHAPEEWQCVVVAVVDLQCIQAVASAVAMVASAVAMVAEAAAMVVEDIAKP